MPFYNSTAQRTKVQSACCQPVTKGVYIYIIYTVHYSYAITHYCHLSIKKKHKIQKTNMNQILWEKSFLKLIICKLFSFSLVSGMYLVPLCSRQLNISGKGHKKRTPCFRRGAPDPDFPFWEALFFFFLIFFYKNHTNVIQCQNSQNRILCIAIMTLLIIFKNIINTRI